MISSSVLRETVDDYLGNGEKRFFAAGYRRVGYTFGEVTVAVLGTGSTLATTIGLRYPADWSKKSSGVDLRPHLSTIDAILLGVQLSEMCLVRTFQPDTAKHRAMWLRKIKIRAGRTPEEELDNLPAGARLLTTRPDPASRCGFVSTVESQVGAMRVRCEIEHAGGEIHGGRSVYWGPDALLGPAETRYYGTGFSRAGYRIEDLAVDVEALRATGSVHLEPAAAGAGIEGAYQPAPTAVEAFAAGLQLGQILLYELDAMERSGSNTLWMRTTLIEISRPDREFTAATPIATSVHNADLVEMNGGTWRTAEIVSELGGIRFTCGIAHALPNR